MKQFLTNEKGERTAVVLPLAEYEDLLDLAEDAEALREAEEALAAIKRSEDEVVPLEQASREIQEGKVETA